MAKDDLLIIPQKEINAIIEQPKILNMRFAKWIPKQDNQPAPQWLELKLVFLDTEDIPIPYLKFHIQYRPPRREFLLPSINILALYKGRRILTAPRGGFLLSLLSLRHLCRKHHTKRPNPIGLLQNHLPNMINMLKKQAIKQKS